MRLAIFGATGGTGIHLVRQAVAAGHDVTAVVRDPARLPRDLIGERPPRGPAGEEAVRDSAGEHAVRDLTGVRVVRADPMNADAITPAVSGHDAVLSAIGPRDGRKPTTVCTGSATAIADAMGRVGVRRLIVVSNSGMHVDDQDGRFVRAVVKPLLGRFLRYAYDDMREMESVVTASGLEWTIVRPPRLIDGAATGRYRTEIGRNVRGGSHIARADLADAVLRCLSDERTIRATVAVAQ